jgi:hypothetical protein
MAGVGELPISPVIVVVTPPKVIPLPARAPKFPAEPKSTAMPKPSPDRSINALASAQPLSRCVLFIIILNNELPNDYYFSGSIATMMSFGYSLEWDYYTCSGH